MKEGRKSHVLFDRKSRIRRRPAKYYGGGRIERGYVESGGRFFEREIIDQAELIAFQSPHLRRMSETHWQDRRTNEYFDAFQLIKRYESEKSDPEWFKERHRAFNVTLIKTQRLLSLDHREDKRHEKTVIKYSSQLSQLIKSNLAKSTELSSSLDRTYPNRLIDRLKSSDDDQITYETLNQDLKKLEDKRRFLDSVGLIEIDKGSEFLSIAEPSTPRSVINVLMLYVEDSFEKLKIFDEIAGKIGLLLHILNKRFKHKRISADKENGFILESTILKNDEDNFEQIHINKLSSGEQNELVLLYELIFRTTPNSLILIDEPEVSLHISWQQSFIDDLREIIKLNNLEALIATHSPDIINNNWHLKVELEGLE